MTCPKPNCALTWLTFLTFTLFMFTFWVCSSPNLSVLPLTKIHPAVHRTWRLPFAAIKNQHEHVRRWVVVMLSRVHHNTMWCNYGQDPTFAQTCNRLSIIFFWLTTLTPSICSPVLPNLSKYAVINWWMSLPTLCPHHIPTNFSIATSSLDSFPVFLCLSISCHCHSVYLNSTPAHPTTHFNFIIRFRFSVISGENSRTP